MLIAHLPYLEPWSWLQFRQHFALRLLSGVETLAPGRYSRTVRIGTATGWFSVRPLPWQAVLELSASDSLEHHFPALCPRVRKMFDLDVDPAAISQHFSGDPHLGPLVAVEPGLRLPSAFDPFEQAVRAIVGQQVTVKAAVTITRRLVERLGRDLQCSCEAEGLLRLFPSPSTIAAAELGNIGMPGKRVETLRNLAAAVADGALDLSIDKGADELVKRLCELPGIGQWTAQYIALRGFGEADAFPVGDLGLLKAPLWGEGGISARTLQAHAESWRPWRAYAAVHIWQNFSAAVAKRARDKIKAAEPSPGSSASP